MVSARGVFVNFNKMTFRAVLDGLSNTIMSGEITTDPGDLDRPSRSSSAWRVDGQATQSGGDGGLRKRGQLYHRTGPHAASILGCPYRHHCRSAKGVEVAIVLHAIQRFCGSSGARFRRMNLLVT